MAEYSSVAVQTVNPGEAIIFTTTVVPCNRGLIQHRENSGTFVLSGWTPNRCASCNCGCNSEARYLAQFGANIAIPETGGTLESIQVSLSLEGASLPDTTMIVTPGATGEYDNISRAVTIPVFKGCCESFTVRNTSTQPILVQNANLILTRPDLTLTY